MLSAIGGRLQIHKYTGSKHDKKWSLTIEMSSQFIVLDVAAVAGMNRVPIVSAS